MYCPNCAAPIDGAKFCRSCGTNVSLVPQALTGKLPEPVRDEDEIRGHHYHRRTKKTLSIESITSTFFTGLAFLFVSFAVRTYAPAGRLWWFWLLIPAFAMMGEAIGKYLKLREQQRQSSAPYHPPAAPPYQPAMPTARPAELDAPTTSGLAAPSSITEHTTRQLDPARPRE
jgi:hypothetical protein